MPPCESIYQGQGGNGKEGQRERVLKESKKKNRSRAISRVTVMFVRLP